MGGKFLKRRLRQIRRAKYWLAENGIQHLQRVLRARGGLNGCFHLFIERLNCRHAGTVLSGLSHCSWCNLQKAGSLVAKRLLPAGSMKAARNYFLAVFLLPRCREIPCAFPGI